MGKECQQAIGGDKEGKIVFNEKWRKALIRLKNTQTHTGSAARQGRYTLLETKSLRYGVRSKKGRRRTVRIEREREMPMRAPQETADFEERGRQSLNVRQIC